MNCQIYHDGVARLFCGKIVIDIKASWRTPQLTPQRARNALKRMGLKPGPWKKAEWGMWCKVTRA